MQYFYFCRTEAEAQGISVYQLKKNRKERRGNEEIGMRTEEHDTEHTNVSILILYKPLPDVRKIKVEAPVPRYFPSERKPCGEASQRII